MMEIWKDNEMTDHIGTVYAKNENELSWLISSWAVYDENQKNNDVTKHIGAIYVKNDIKL